MPTMIVIASARLMDFLLFEWSYRGLFRAAHVTLGDHVDFVDRLGVVPDTVGSSVFLSVWGLHARAFGVENFLAGAGKRNTGGRSWQRDDAQIFSFGAENLNAGIARGDVEAALGVDGHAIAVAAAFELGKVVPIGGGAIGFDIEGHQNISVGYKERLFIAAERHAVCAQFLAGDEADLAGGIDEVGAIVVGEVDAALGIADEFAHAPECLAVVFAGQGLMLLALFDDDQLRRLMALVGMAARIRAGALNADNAALVVDAESAGAVSVRGKDGEFVLWIELANGAGLLLRK